MYSYLANPAATRSVMEQFGLSANYRLGQNFLINDAVIGHILDLAELCTTDVVYEIGPGIGTLTVALLPQVKSVIAVEADRNLIPVLAETSSTVGGELAIVPGDALRVTSHDLEDAITGGARPTKLVANLPYQIAATVLMRTFEQMPSVHRAVVMVQAEVADRIAASPGSKVYGAYTAKLALFGTVTGRFSVAAGNFMPAPRVNSAVVRIERMVAYHPVTHAPLTSDDCTWTAHVIDGAFAQRRKTIRNSLMASGFTQARLDAAFTHTGIAPTIRAEMLSSSDFVRLADALK